MRRDLVSIYPGAVYEKLINDAKKKQSVSKFN